MVCANDLTLSLCPFADTEGSFMAERAMDICQATAQHVKGTIQSWQAQGGGPGLQQAMREVCDH